MSLVKKAGRPPPHGSGVRVGTFHDDIADCRTGLGCPNENAVWLFECESRFDVANRCGMEKDLPARIEQYYIYAGLSPAVLDVSREGISASLKIVNCDIIMAGCGVVFPIIDQWRQW